MVTRFTSAGTQLGPLMGIAPTGRRVSWDMEGMLQQLGASSLPGR